MIFIYRKAIYFSFHFKIFSNTFKSHEGTIKIKEAPFYKLYSTNVREIWNKWFLIIEGEFWFKILSSYICTFNICISIYLHTSKDSEIIIDYKASNLVQFSEDSIKLIVDPGFSYKLFSLVQDRVISNIFVFIKISIIFARIYISTLVSLWRPAASPQIATSLCIVSMN